MLVILSGRFMRINKIEGMIRIGRLFEAITGKGRKKWQKPGTKGSVSGTGGRRRSRRWRRSRTGSRTKAIMTGPICWLMSMRMEIFLRGPLISRDSKPDKIGPPERRAYFFNMVMGKNLPIFDGSPLGYWVSGFEETGMIFGGI